MSLCLLTGTAMSPSTIELVWDIIHSTVTEEVYKRMNVEIGGQCLIDSSLCCEPKYDDYVSGCYSCAPPASMFFLFITDPGIKCE